VRVRADRVNGSPEVWITRQRLHHGWRVLREVGTQGRLQLVQIGENLPRHAAPEIVPEPLGGIEFRAVGRQKDEGHIGWEAQPFARMHRAVVKDQYIEGVGEGRGKAIQKDLHRGRIHMRQNQRKGLTAHGRNGSVHPRIEILVLDRSDRLDPNPRDPSPTNRFQPKARFILAMDFNGKGAIGGNGGPNPRFDLRFEGVVSFRRFFYGAGGPPWGAP